MTLLDSRNYTVGWICALPVEMAAATAMLDEEHGKPTQQDSHDKYTYTLGKIGQHNVVIACLPDGVVGTTSAAALGVQMRSSFRCIRFGLMIGVGGGVPSRLHDIRLGDVVVSKPRGTSSGVIQYDYGKAVENGQLIMDGSLDKPPKTLLTAMSSLEADHLRRGNGISGHISKMLYKHPHMQQHFKHQGLENDILYAADYKHTTGFHCAQCDPKRQVIRAPRNSLNPAIFYGTIGSGNQVMKDGITRDKLASEKDILCFEMEAAGLMDHFPCLVIRGICDYADSHKNKRWQEYAAATAAAYAKELLCTIPASYDDDEDLSMMDGLRARSNTGSSIGSGSSLSRRPTIALENINMDALPSSIFELASRLYAKEDISLASLIPDRRYPNQDALVEIQLEERKDYSISIDRNFSDFVKSNAKSNSGFKRALSKIFLSPAVKEVGGDVQILAEESRVYMMRQPREIFKKLSGRQSVRDWLTDYYMNSDEDIYFIVGYRTLVNAQFMATDLKVNQKTQQSRSHPGARENYRYETTGERIYAICFRRVSITSLRNGTPGSMLDSTNYWKTFAEDRGMEMDTEEEILSADLDEEDDLEEEAFGITTGGPDDSELELVV
ncbi:hypothetical protein TWF191_004660 [Orbilia oligospora]|uniref:Nucleoside phosphorylase domain-containing protein n=1 Tax=Orbilia oligospora TaxID=2813651 RepID=A0A7C8QYM9_ORBOL|nr:hypothetical protein TWF191_004660 [Orbilia oligospora]